MRSHTYAFTARELAGATLPPLAGFALLAVVLHGLAVARLLPDALPLRDMDHAVLWHQIDSRHQPAQVVLVGDSSCLMGVSARQLSDALQVPVRNLGAMSTLGLDAFAELAGDAAAAAGPAPPELVLLVHPEFLRRPRPDSRMAALFGSLREQGVASSSGGNAWQNFVRLAGLDLFRDHLESYLRPQPLPGAFRTRYGFTRELLSAMDADGGGAVDPGRFQPTPSSVLPPLAISPRLEEPAAAFATRLPAGTRLRVGIMPIPFSLAGPDHASRQVQALQNLCHWLGPKATPLSTLPDVLPDDLFATATHLNEAGREIYTRRLAEALRLAD